MMQTGIPHQLDNLFALFYGAPKSGKTTFALQPCESNYAITVLDLENNLYPASRWKNCDNINVINLKWEGEANQTPAITFLLALRDARRRPFTWDCTDKQMAKATLDPTHVYCRVNLAKARPDDLLVLDSWTMFSQQITAAKVANAYSVNAQTAEISQPMWGNMVRDAEGTINILNSIPVISKVVLAHEYMEPSLTTPMSVTRAHGQSLAKSFTVVARFLNRNIDIIAGANKAQREKKVLDKYTFSMLLSELGRTAPTTFTPSEAFVFEMGDEMAKLVANDSRLAINTTNVNVNIRK